MNASATYRVSMIWRVKVLLFVFTAICMSLIFTLNVLAEARPASLVKDIFPGDPEDSSDPRFFAVVSDTLYFVADDADHGAELWKSDGTEIGTELVRDIAPGSGETLVPGGLTGFGGMLYFNGDDGSVSGEELWVSDGTEGGTNMLVDINPTGSSRPQRFQESGGLLFFSASDGVNGVELWKTDGTMTNTVMVTNIHPSASSSPTILTDVDGTLFFVADDGQHGDELWTSDGTPAGTVLVTDIISGPMGSSARDLVSLGSELLFTANDGINGRALWRSDGTPAGTSMIVDVDPDTDPISGPDKLTVVGNVVFFTVDDGSNGLELWKSDGTVEGTVMVHDITSGPGSSLPNELTALGNQLYFSAVDGVHGRELWRSDGTASGTSLVKDVNPGAPNGTSSLLAVYDGVLYFVGNDGINGGELWRSEGQESNTFLLSDIHASSSSQPGPLVGLGSQIIFSAEDEAVGRELWSVDLLNGGPTSDAGGPYNGVEGDAITLSASASDPDGDTLQAGWTVNSPLCSFEDATQLQTDLTCGDNGSFEATLTVTDPFGIANSSIASIDVQNVAPQIQSVDDSASTGGYVSLQVTFVDNGSADSHNYEVTWDDGEVTMGDVTSGQTTFTVTHTYQISGEFDINIELMDDDGGVDSVIHPASVQFVIHLPTILRY